MNLPEILQKGFAGTTKRLIGIFAQMSHEEMHFRAMGNTNPLIWQLGHLNFVRNTITKLIDSDAKLEVMPSEKELFGPGCQIANPEAYPSTEEMMAVFTARGERIVEMLKTVSEAQLSAESPFAHLAFFGPTRGEQIYGFFLHENQHYGEANMTRTIIVKNRA